jgi:hypothetical protein
MAVPTNPNWGRWVVASVTDEFMDDFASSDYKLLADGQILIESTDEKGQLELRIDGPVNRQPSSGFYILEDIVINCHVQVYNGNGLYEKNRIAGLLEVWLGRDHCIYRYGDGVDDDDTYFGSLVLQTRGRLDGVKTHYFGKEENDNFEQLSVEANYNIYLSQGD